MPGITEKDNEEEGCPKCGAPRTGRPDCPRCGLLFEQWDPEGLRPGPDPVLDPVWEKLVEDFDEAYAQLFSRFGAIFLSPRRM